MIDHSIKRFTPALIQAGPSAVPSTESCLITGRNRLHLATGILRRVLPSIGHLFALLLQEEGGGGGGGGDGRRRLAWFAEDSMPVLRVAVRFSGFRLLFPMPFSLTLGPQLGSV